MCRGRVYDLLQLHLCDDPKHLPQEGSERGLLPFFTSPLWKYGRMRNSVMLFMKQIFAGLSIHCNVTLVMGLL